MNMSVKKDSYVVRCNSFYNAAKYAAEKGWHISEWAWLPAYTVQNRIQVFERVEDED